MTVRSTDAREQAVLLPFDGGPEEQAVTTQAVRVVAPATRFSDPRHPLQWRVLAPVTERGEVIGLVEFVLPDVPTLAESGVAGYAADFTLVMLAPRGVPDAIVGRFRQAFVDALHAPDIVEKLRAGDQTVVGSTPGEAAAVLAADSAKWGAVARRIHLGLD